MATTKFPEVSAAGKNFNVTLFNVHPAAELSVVKLVARQLLNVTFKELQVAEVKADRVVEICGDLSDICVALVSDRRFRINGVLTHGREAAVVGLIESTHKPSVPVGEADSSLAQPGYIEFLAAKCGSDGEVDDDIHNTVHFRIKIWRMGEQLFHASVQQRRC